MISRALQAGADQGVGRRPLAEGGGGLGDRGVGFAAAVAEVDERRDGIGGRTARAGDRRCGERAARCRKIDQALAQLARDPAGKPRADAARPAQRRLVLGGDRARQLVGASTESRPSATRAPTPWTVCSSRNQTRSAGSLKPYRAMLSPAAGSRRGGRPPRRRPAARRACAPSTRPDSRRRRRRSPRGPRRCRRAGRAAARSPQRTGRGQRGGETRPPAW